MKITREESLVNFEFWSGAKQFAALLTEDEINSIEDILEDLYPGGLSETEINDIFWFEPDTLAEWIGYQDSDEIWDERWKA